MRLLQRHKQRRVAGGITFEIKLSIIVPFRGSTLLLPFSPCSCPFWLSLSFCHLFFSEALLLKLSTTVLVRLDVEPLRLIDVASNGVFYHVIQKREISLTCNSPNIFVFSILVLTVSCGRTERERADLDKFWRTNLQRDRTRYLHSLHLLST